MSAKPSLRKAQEFAKRKHFPQIRKDGKTLYWTHLAKVVESLNAIGIEDANILCAGWLHDTIEDTATDFDEIKDEFGERVAAIVATLTKDKRLPEERRESEYVTLLSKADWAAQAVKFCDIWANVVDLKSGYKSKTKRRSQVEKKLRYFRAIRNGLAKNAKSIPKLDNGIEEVNRLIAEYGHSISLRL